MEERENDQNVANTRRLSKNVDAVGWGVFFVWMGITLLANVGWGVGLLGVGLIAVAAQAARKYFGLPLEPFWLIIGSAFIVWGVWDTIGFGEAQIPSNLLPILFIGVGIVVVVSALVRKPPK